jgi:hypothetical protein
VAGRQECCSCAHTILLTNGCISPNSVPWASPHEIAFPPISCPNRLPDTSRRCSLWYDLLTGTIFSLARSSLWHDPVSGTIRSLARSPLSSDLPDLYPQPRDQAQGWGLTFFLHAHPAGTGRSGSTGWWAGLPNLFWWADRENGLGSIRASQILPFGGEWETTIPVLFSPHY